MIDDYGEALAVDFRREYPGLSVTSILAGDVSPREAVLLINGLPEGGHYYSSRMGGEDADAFLGVDKTYRLLAAHFDAINANTVATGNFGKKRPKIDPWPLPETVKKRNEERRQQRTLKGLHALFSRGLH